MNSRLRRDPWYWHHRVKRHRKAIAISEQIPNFVMFVGLLIVFWAYAGLARWTV